MAVSTLCYVVCFACVVPFLNTTLLSFLLGVVSRLSCTDDPSGLFCVFVVYFYSLLLESLPPQTLFPSWEGKSDGASVVVLLNDTPCFLTLHYHHHHLHQFYSAKFSSENFWSHRSWSLCFSPSTCRQLYPPTVLFGSLAREWKKQNGSAYLSDSSL